MTPKPQRGTPDGDATLAIQKLARETGGDVQELQTLYVLEALLARIATSPHRDDFVLKGGVLLAAFAARRPTKDIDLQATGLSNDADDVAAYRCVPLTPVLPALAEMPQRAQPKWRAGRTRVNRQKELPEAFADVLKEVARFSDPVLLGAAKGSWKAAERGWTDHNR